MLQDDTQLCQKHSGKCSTTHSRPAKAQAGDYGWATFAKHQLIAKTSLRFSLFLSLLNLSKNWTCVFVCVCVAVLRLRNKFSKELLCRACAADNFKPVTGEEVPEKGVSHSTMWKLETWQGSLRFLAGSYRKGCRGVEYTSEKTIMWKTTFSLWWFVKIHLELIDLLFVQGYGIDMPEFLVVTREV